MRIEGNRAIRGPEPETVESTSPGHPACCATAVSAESGRKAPAPEPRPEPHPGRDQPPSTGVPAHSNTLAGRVRAWVGRRQAVCGIGFSLFLTAIIGLADYLTPPQVLMAPLYLVPVGISSWFAGRVAGVCTAFLVLAVSFCADFRVITGLPSLVFLWNAGLRLLMLLALVAVLTRIHLLQRGLRQLVEQRTAQLEAEVAQRTAVEREISNIADREQQRISHELHDGLGQHLAALAFRAKALEHTLKEEGNAGVAEAGELCVLARTAITQARSLARGLDPIELEDNDLEAALQNLAAEAAARFGVAVEFQGGGEDRPLCVGKPVALALYRICQEAIHNAVEHGKANRIEVSLTRDSGGLRLRVYNDGAGFRSPSGKSSGSGLRIMTYRASSVGAGLRIAPGPERGTVVTCLVPAASLSDAPAGAGSGPAPLAQ